MNGQGNVWPSDMGLRELCIRTTQLIEELGSDDAMVRSNAMCQLEIDDDTQLAWFLIDCLDGYDAGLRSAASRTLLRMNGGDGVFLVVSALAVPDSSRNAAARAMQHVDDPRPLIRHMREVVNPNYPGQDSHTPRYEAMEALARLGDARAIPALVDALHHGERNVRAAAADALGKLGGDSAAQPLTRVLEYDWSYRPPVHAVRALARIGTDRAWDALFERLHLLIPDRAYYAAMWEIEKAGELRAVPELVGILERALEGIMVNPEGIAAVTARTLARLDHTEVVDGLRAEFEDPLTDPWRRPVAALALGQFRDQRAVESLIHSLQDDDSRLRRAAANALGQLGDAGSIGPLEDLIDDKDSEVRCAVDYALNRLRK